MKKATALLLSLVLFCGILPMNALAAHGVIFPPYTEDAAFAPYITRNGDDVSVDYVSLPHALALGLGIIQGDGKGEMNWERTLTRVEAVTMLVRLMGAEEAAQQLSGQPTTFTDVPNWAKGYVNYAHANKLVQGEGNGLFAPDRVCTAAEFLTMLYRLTDLKEGTDYTWNTAVRDFITDVSETPAYNVGEFIDLGSSEYGGALINEAFTRELAASTIFRMMNINAAGGVQSVADLLATEYGLSSTVFYDCYVRRTGFTMRGQTQKTVGLGTLGDATFSLSEGKLYMDEPKNVEVSFFVNGEYWEDKTISSSKPFLLPEEKCQLTMSYFDSDNSYYYTAFLHIDRFDGQPGFTLYEDAVLPDYAIYYAIEEDGFHLRTQAEAAKWPPATISDEIHALATELVKGKSTEYEKALAICDWVSEHIYYDFDDFWDHIPTPKDTLAVRRGVCGNYADLTEKLMTAAGLKCYTEVSDTHAWNAALLDGEWVLVDNTWDSPLEYRHGKYLIHDSSRPEREEETDERLARSHPVDNMLEPNAESKHKYFDMYPQAFYSYGDHRPSRDPAFYL